MTNLGQPPDTELLLNSIISRPELNIKTLNILSQMSFLHLMRLFLEKRDHSRVTRVGHVYWCEGRQLEPENELEMISWAKDEDESLAPPNWQ